MKRKTGRKCKRADYAAAQSLKVIMPNYSMNASNGDGAVDGTFTVQFSSRFLDY